MIRATTAIVVPTGLTGGNVFSHSQAARNYLRDKIIKCAVHGAHICFVPVSVVMGQASFFSNYKMSQGGMSCNILIMINQAKCALTVSEALGR